MDASTTTKAGYGQPALVGGLVMGVMSALPLINALNLCCCLWVVSGGLVASYLLQQNQPLPMTAGDGAIVGLFAGLIGAVIMSALLIPIGLLLEPLGRAIAARTLEMSGTMPPAIRELLQNYAEPRTAIGVLGQVVFRVILLCFLLLLGAIFSTLGGLLGVALFKKRITLPSAPSA